MIRSWTEFEINAKLYDHQQQEVANPVPAVISNSNRQQQSDNSKASKASIDINVMPSLPPISDLSSLLHPDSSCEVGEKLNRQNRLDDSDLPSGPSAAHMDTQHYGYPQHPMHSHLSFSILQKGSINNNNNNPCDDFVRCSF